MARPFKDIDWNLVQRKMQAGCTVLEMIGDLNPRITEETFYRRFSQQFGESYQNYKGSFHSIGKGNIKVTQYEKALEGNTQMLTLLGQEWLEQGKTKDQIPPNDSKIDSENNDMIEKHTMRSRIKELEDKIDNLTKTRSESIRSELQV